MTRWYIIGFLFLTFTSQAQNDLQELIAKSFFSKKIYKKVFFEYTGQNKTLNKKYEHLNTAFILPDTTLQNKFPDLIERVTSSWVKEQNFVTTVYVEDPRGIISITQHILDPDLLILVDFDEIFIFGNRAHLVFHTTSHIEQKGSRYYRMECYLKKKRGNWKCSRSRVTKIPYPSHEW